MDLEHLTTSQVVLLVLLVSFVTSIATGIVTVSLLAQTPPAITQTINRVVERTIETVVPETNQAASVVTKETTVVVKEDDLITESVGKGFERVARIYQDTATSSPIVALGAVTGNGTIITDLSQVSKDHAVVVGGETYRYSVSAKIPELGVAFMTATGTAPSISPFKGVDVGSLKLGQMVIGIFGARSNRVTTGAVGSVYDAITIKAGDKDVSLHFIDAGISDTVTAGTPLITIFGDLAGISTSVSRAEGADVFVSYGDITALLAAQATATTTKTQ